MKLLFLSLFGFLVLFINGPLVYADKGGMPSAAAPHTLKFFFASWCEFCAKEAPQIEKLRVQLASCPIEFVAIGLDDEAKDSQKALTSWKVQTKFIHDSDFKLKKQFGVKKIPALFVTDRNDRVILKSSGASEVEDFHKKLLELFESQNCASKNVN